MIIVVFTTPSKSLPSNHKIINIAWDLPHENLLQTEF